MNEIVEEFKITNCKVSSIPIDPSNSLDTLETDIPLSPYEKRIYQ